MNIAYIRVSTIDQNEERQIKAMEKENIKKYFLRSEILFINS
jgi:DNA invertase Pin-like site-specific DNA recombinase